MVTTQQLGNFLRYGLFDLRFQVDPEVMKPIFEDSIKQLSFKTWRDCLDLSKPNRDSLKVEYTPTEDSCAYFRVVIHARNPRPYFGKVDVSSFMDIEEFHYDAKKELMGVIKDVVKKTGIEKVILSCGDGGIIRKDATFLRRVKADKPGSHLKYGLGP